MMTMIEIKKAEKMGEYKPTLIDQRKKEADILIEYCNGGSFTISNQKNISIEGRGVKRVYENGNIEVTSSLLAKLQKMYKVESNF